MIPNYSCVRIDTLQDQVAILAMVHIYVGRVRTRASSLEVCMPSNMLYIPIIIVA